LAMTPSRCISCAQLSGPSSTIAFTCIDIQQESWQQQTTAIRIKLLAGKSK
jgi:hypothetical protein